MPKRSKAKPYRETVDRLTAELTTCQQGRAADKRLLAAKREHAETELRYVKRQQHRERHRYRQLIRALIDERNALRAKLQEAIDLRRAIERGGKPPFPGHKH